MFHIGHVIRQLRIDKGWSEKELSQETGGLSSTTIAGVEKGTTNPTLATLETIAGALGMKIEQLFLRLALTDDERKLVELWQAMKNPKARDKVVTFMTSHGIAEASARQLEIAAEQREAALRQHAEQQLDLPTPPSPPSSTPNNPPTLSRRRR